MLALMDFSLKSEILHAELMSEHLVGIHRLAFAVVSSPRAMRWPPKCHSSGSHLNQTNAGRDELHPSSLRSLQTIPGSRREALMSACFSLFNFHAHGPEVTSECDTAY